MTMFASKTPRDLNHDPEPWADESGMRWDSPGDGAWHMPRPEFDHVQHNEPNPIMVEFRKDRALNPTIPASHLAMIWLDRDLFAFETPSATLAHAAHARRVLTRLTNLSTPKEN